MNINKGARILINILYLLYIAMVLFFCFYKFSSSNIDLAKHFLGIRLDRYAHFIMFFPYPFISWLTLKYSNDQSWVSRKALTLTIVSGLLFALATEICQDLFFESRQGDALDFAADSAAIISGSIIAYLIGPFMVKIVTALTTRKTRNSYLVLVLSLMLLPSLCGNQPVYGATDKRDSVKADRNERLFSGEPVRTAVKLNAAALLGVANPSVEFRVHKYITVGMEAWGVFYNEGIGSLINGPVLLGMTFLESRYYPVESFRGFFVGPNAGFAFFCMTKGVHPMYWGDYTNAYQVGTNFMLGLTVGYAFTLSKHWGIEISIGGGYQHSTYEGHRLDDGSMYIGWNESAEWLPYKAAVNIVYKW